MGRLETVVLVQVSRPCSTAHVSAEILKLEVYAVVNERRPMTRGRSDTNGRSSEDAANNSSYEPSEDEVDDDDDDDKVSQKRR